MADVNIDNRRYPRERVERVVVNEDYSSGWAALLIVLIIIAAIIIILLFYQNQFNAEETGDRIIDRTRDITEIKREEITRTNTTTTSDVDINIVPNISSNIGY